MESIRRYFLPLKCLPSASKVTQLQRPVSNLKKLIGGKRALNKETKSVGKHRPGHLYLAVEDMNSPRKKGEERWVLFINRVGVCQASGSHTRRK